MKMTREERQMAVSQLGLALLMEGMPTLMDQHGHKPGATVCNEMVETCHYLAAQYVFVAMDDPH